MVGRVQVGTVVEIVTPRGLAYAQYSHRNPLCGDLLRILPGFHDLRPDNFAIIANQPESFFVFLPLRAAIVQGKLTVVAREAIPEAARPFPLFRTRGAIEPTTGRVMDWWLWDGVREWKIGQLTPEQERLPIRSIWNVELLVERLLERWKPYEGDENAASQGVDHREALESVPFRGLSHYLYFEGRREAEKAADRLTSEGFPSEIQPVEDKAAWLVLITDLHTQTAPEIAVLRAYLEDLATALGGHYDGWEMIVAE